MNARLNKNKTAEKGRKDRILDAAEEVFAESGFHGASLRAIVLKARVNLATVYYYFGSKEGLMLATLDRRFAPLREEHVAMLKKLEGLQPLPLEKVIEAMIIPPLRLASSESGKAQIAMRLIGRIVTEPNPQTQERLRSQYADIRHGFIAAFQRCLPNLPPCDLRWRIEFAWGALAFTMCNPRKIEKESEGLCNPRDTNAVIEQMVGFFKGGFLAPATGAKPPAS